MSRQNYRDELNILRLDVEEMGESVRDQLSRSLRALERGDERLAKTVIEGDAAINETYLELEQRCIDLIALQQPVASDLRFVSASFKIITDLERIGDLATNLAKYAQDATRRESLPDVNVNHLGAVASEMLEDALDAYWDDDVDACREIAARDDELDVLCQRASQQIIRNLLQTEQMGASEWGVEQRLDDVSRLLLTVRELERVGDHAVNIAARTLYMVENDPELLY